MIAFLITLALGQQLEPPRILPTPQAPAKVLPAPQAPTCAAVVNVEVRTIGHAATGRRRGHRLFGGRCR